MLKKKDNTKIVKRFETTMFGLPIIMRHDYQDKEMGLTYLEKIK